MSREAHVTGFSIGSILGLLFSSRGLVLLFLIWLSMRWWTSPSVHFARVQKMDKKFVHSRILQCRLRYHRDHGVSAPPSVGAQCRTDAKAALVQQKEARAQFFRDHGHTEESIAWHVYGKKSAD